MYTFEVRNTTTGCNVTLNHTVEDPNTFDFAVNKLADVICFGDDGSIEISFTDTTYTGAYNWEVLNSDGTITTRTDDEGSFTGNGTTASIPVAAGNFIIRVTQVSLPECHKDRFVTITTPTAPITLDPISLTNVGCSNNEGTAAVTPQGGQGPYTIVLTNTTTSVSTTFTGNSQLFQNLTAGEYTIAITDALGCTNTYVDEFELILPDPISGTITATSLVCAGDNDASVSFSLNSRNISPNYRYTLNRYDDAAGSSLVQSSTSQTVATFLNLSAGFYSITVLDDINCTFESTIIEIVDPTETSGMLLTAASLSCNNDASLELTAMGGTAPYMWSVDGINFNAMNEVNGPNTHLFQNITAGSYQYFVRDSFNCISGISNEISIDSIEPLTLDLDLTGATINCNGESTALIQAVADGGLGNYEYGLFADATLSTVVIPYQSNGIFADLPQGIYYVSVLSGDCELVSQEIEIEEPLPLDINTDVTDVSCEGEIDGSVVIDAQGGSGGYQYAISPNLNQFVETNSFTELAAGDYELIVQDINGCFEFIEFTITEPEAIEMTFTATPEICSGDQDGTITLTITGGTAPYSTSINSNNDSDFVEGRLTFDSLASDTYVVFVRDANGCTINEIIEIEAGANLNVTPEVIYECNGDTASNRLELTFEDPSVQTDVLYGLDTIDPNNMVLEPNFDSLSPGDHFVTIAHANGCINTVDFTVEEFLPLLVVAEEQSINEITALVSGGREDYTYYFNDVNNGDDNTFYITETDTYTVRVVDANGCEAITTIFIEFIDIEIPTFFTPDGDGVNDLWLPRNISQFPNFFMKIYDRYGREIYSYQDNKDGWDGFYNLRGLPTGDYWYIIKLNGEEDQRELIGNFTLYR